MPDRGEKVVSVATPVIRASTIDFTPFQMFIYCLYRTLLAKSILLSHKLLGPWFKK